MSDSAEGLEEQLRSWSSESQSSRIDLMGQTSQPLERISGSSLRRTVPQVILSGLSILRTTSKPNVGLTSLRLVISRMLIVSVEFNLPEI